MFHTRFIPVVISYLVSYLFRTRFIPLVAYLSYCIRCFIPLVPHLFHTCFIGYTPWLPCHTSEIILSQKLTPEKNTKTRPTQRSRARGARGGGLQGGRGAPPSSPLPAPPPLWGWGGGTPPGGPGRTALPSPRPAAMGNLLFGGGEDRMCGPSPRYDYAYYNI